MQVGLLVADESEPAVPMARVLRHELEIRGSHVCKRVSIPRCSLRLPTVCSPPAKLVGRRVGLEEAVDLLVSEEAFASPRSDRDRSLLRDKQM